MTKIENTVESLTSQLEKTKENLKKLRNLRKEAGSKILVEESWRRYLEEQIKNWKRSGSVS
jgi:hypothetical protein